MLPQLSDETPTLSRSTNKLHGLILTHLYHRQQFLSFKSRFPRQLVGCAASWVLRQCHRRSHDSPESPLAVGAFYEFPFLHYSFDLSSLFFCTTFFLYRFLLNLLSLFCTQHLQKYSLYKNTDHAHRDNRATGKQVQLPETICYHFEADVRRWYTVPR